MKNVLIILGMHRSGTSLIAQWIYKCGLNIGESFVPAGIGNEDGFFEDWDFIKIHEDILKFNALSPTGLISESASNINLYYKEKLALNVELKNRLNDQWGWKDPRTCLFLEEYRHILPDAKNIIILRPYAEVINSLVKREFKIMEYFYLKKANALNKKIWPYKRKRKLEELYVALSEKYLQVWTYYNSELLRHIKSLNKNNYIVINYLMLLKNSESIFQILKLKWNFNLSPVDFNSIYKAELLSKPHNIQVYLKDKKLSAKADEIMAELEKFTFEI